MEIERKWLVDRSAIPFSLDSFQSCLIEQAYVSFCPTIRIRNINDGEKLIITVKTRPDTLQNSKLQCEEIEAPLSLREYTALKERAYGNTICKRRFFIPLENGLTGELDIFSGKLEGLCLLEIEFPDVDAALSYPDPHWIRKDVTYDFRYKNSSLVQDGLPSDTVVHQ